MRRLPILVALLAGACSGGREEAPAPADTAPAVAPPVSPHPVGDSVGTFPPLAPPGTVDTSGVGVNPPTAGGQLVDTAAVPGKPDTSQGTPTAP